jgi:hypothetical protein
MAWKDGFKVGYEMSKIEIPSMSAELAQYQKSIDQKKLLKAQGKAAEAARKEGVIDATGKNMTFFTTGFDDTGMSDYDAFADKILNTFDNASAMNNWKFRNGQMSEEEYKRDQNKMVRAFGSLNSVYQNIQSKATGQETLSQEGKDNIVNTFKAELIELYGKNISFQYENGELKMTTIGPNGQEVVAVPSILKSLTTNDSGADINSAVEELVNSKGTSKYFNEDFSKKYTSYSFNDKNVLDLVSVTVNSFNENQVVDAAFKLGLLTTDPKEAKENEGVEYMDFLSWSTVDKEKIDELKVSVKQAMADHTKEMFRLKFSSEQMKPEKDDKDSLIPIAITKANDPGIEYADGIKAGKEYDSDSILGTILTASGKELTNSAVIKNVEGLDDKQEARFKKINYDLYDESGNYIGNEKSKVKIYALNTPSVLTSKELQDISISSSSDKKWKSISGFVLVKNLGAGDRSGTLKPKGVVSPYNIRIKGNVSSSVTTTKEQAGVGAKDKEGKDYKMDVSSTEKTEKVTPDVSNPLNDSDLFSLWRYYASKNSQIRDAFTMVKTKKESNGEDMSDPNVFRNAIGETLEMLQK